MRLIVEVVARGAGRPPAGSPVRVQLRDTSLADAPARIVAEKTGAVRGDEPGAPLETLPIDCSGVTDGLTLWAHVDVDRDGEVSRGDWLTTVSYPVSATVGRYVLEVGRI